MTGQSPLFLPGWEIEPCDTAPPPARTSHPYASLADNDEPRAYRTTVTIHRPETCCDRDRAH